MISAQDPFADNQIPQRLQILEEQVASIGPSGPIAQTSIGEFKAVILPDGSGFRISFALHLPAGVVKLVLARNTNLDQATANELNAWSQPFIADQRFEFQDSDPALKGKTVSYWIRLSNFGGEPVIVGPQTVNFNADTNPPDAIVTFDASHGAAAAGIVRVNVSYVPPPQRFGSAKIYISGYNGVAAKVAIAQNSSSPFGFKLKATGEVVTLTAIAVSINGIEAATGPAKVLTLGSGATAPAQIQSVSAAGLTTGVQVDFSAGAEADITSFQIWRAIQGAGFGAAINIAGVVPTGSARYSYLDTTGLTGVYEYYVIAVNAAGSSAASMAATNIITSQNLPPNSPQNATNNATVDSVDAGAGATIRIYGPGGVGSTWLRYAGQGNVTYPTGLITSLAYSTKYYVLYDGAAYVALTTQPATVGDKYTFVGTVVTTAAGGAGGSGAAATANLSGGAVASVTITAGGMNYFTAPSVSFTGGGGTGATGTAAISGGAVTGVIVTSGGSAYVTPPVIGFTGGGSGTTGGGTSTGDSGGRYGYAVQ